MTADQWFNIVGGIISVIAFVFSVWVWLRSDMKVRELRSVIQTCYDVSGSISWEMSQHPGEDQYVRLRHAERALGQVEAIHTLTGKHADTASSRSHTDIDALVERGVLWDNEMIWNLEKSSQIREVWLVTPDFEPDLSEREVGIAVRNNIRRGVRYVYFVPAELGDVAEMRAGLQENLGLSKAQRLAGRVTIVEVSRAVETDLFQRGNTILYFEGDPSTSTFYALEEVVLTKISRRGTFWQEHPKAVAEGVRRTLRAHLAIAMVEPQTDEVLKAVE